MKRHTAFLMALLAGAIPALAEPLRVDNLAPGTTLRYPVALLRGEACLPDGTPLVVTNTTSTRPSREFRTQVTRGRFKALMELVPGRNLLALAAGDARLALPLVYRPQTNPHFVRVVYFVDQSGDTTYQSEVPGDRQDYAARLDVAAKLLQTFTAERMSDLGYGRKTFRLELDDEGRVVVHVLRGTQPVSYYHAKEGGALWDEIGAQIRREIPAPAAKNIAIMAFTRFDPATKRALAHTALGGGDLALFGSAGLFAWPASLQDVPRAFGDATRVDPSRTHDDSCFRSTYWGLAATTLGAVLHELGHTFGLPHSPDAYDIMSRGFDLLNRAFTLIEPPSAQRPVAFAFPDNTVPYFGPVNAARLAASRWFEDDARRYRDDVRQPSVRLHAATGKVVVDAPHGIRVLGVNSIDDGEVRSCASTYFQRPPKRLELAREDLTSQADGLPFALVVIDTQGTQVDIDSGRLVDPSSFVRTWRLAAQPVAWPATEAFVAADPAALAESLARRRAVTSPDAYINLAAHYRRRTDFRVAYALCRVRSSHDQSVNLLTGSDDALRVWVNGRLVLEKLALRSASPDQDSTPVTLRAGENTLLVEVSNGEGDWGFFLRFADTSGRHLVLGRAGYLVPLEAR